MVVVGVRQRGSPAVGGAVGVLAAGGLSSGAGRDRALLFKGKNKKKKRSFHEKVYCPSLKNVGDNFCR